MPDEAWPDAVDLTALLYLAVVLLGLPALGYVFAVLDYRAYLRSLRRALVVVREHLSYPPVWAIRQEPTCLEALGLTAPVTEEEVYAAYRLKVKAVHPDLGGPRREFDRLQEHLRQALELAREG